MRFCIVQPRWPRAPSAARSAVVGADRVAAPAPNDLFDRALRADAGQAAVHPLYPRPIHRDHDVQPARQAARRRTARVIAAPPARVLMTYTDPERRTIAIDGKSLIVVWPDRGEREKIDISQTQKRIDQYFTQATHRTAAIDVRHRGRSPIRRCARPIASTCGRSANRSRKGSSG